VTLFVTKNKQNCMETQSGLAMDNIIQMFAWKGSECQTCLVCTRPIACRKPMQTTDNIQT